jgi:hypothetical protein
LQAPLAPAADFNLKAVKFQNSKSPALKTNFFHGNCPNAQLFKQTIIAHFFIACFFGAAPAEARPLPGAKRDFAGKDKGCMF